MMIGPRTLARAAQRLVPQGPSGATLLCYHLVGAGADTPVDLPAATFRRQMEELHDVAAVVHLDEALARVERGEVAERPLAVLTFDDAYENFYTHVLPVLRSLALPATLYVPVGFVDGRCGPPIARTARLRAMTWSQLADVTGDGLVRVGSHGDTHSDLRSPGLDLAREVADSRTALEDRLGTAVDSFCYPRGLWSPSAEREVARNYGSAVVAGGWRVAARRLHRHRLGRIPIRRDMPVSIAPVVGAAVWLEEWMAATARAIRR